MPEANDGDLVITPTGLRVPAHALTWRFSRSGGPGGQHVNTSDTRVELVCDLRAIEGPEESLRRVREQLGDRVRIVSSSARSQRRNREAALERLAERLERASDRKPVRRPTRPHRGAVEARLEEKRRNSRLKQARRAESEEQ